MLYLIISILMGWAMTLVHLDDFFQIFIGTTDKQYFLIWFFIGAVVWITNKFQPQTKK